MQSWWDRQDAAIDVPNNVVSSSAFIEASNPKSALFYFSFLLQFTDPDASLGLGWQLFLLGACANLLFSAADVFCAAIVAPAPIIAQVKPNAIQPIIFRNFITAVPPSGSKIEFHAAVRISGVQSVFPTDYAFIISAFFVFVMNDF